ncbi:three-helix bundle dimerization domain-containing protein [Nocardiopsis sp. NPDC006938]|uniref:three-helix bundle dimerization domain-containing protein n=1 Tax=Nocardiopsis sp. NPDC006938 TaxID=3364337 RepID=UPI0036801590
MLQTFPVQDLRQISARLHDEFSGLSPRRVERCVTDTWHCAEHLGITVTPHLVERVAREHLEAVVNSVPPSAVRRAARRSGTTLFTGHRAVPEPR